MSNHQGSSALASAIRIVTERPEGFPLDDVEAAASVLAALDGAGWVLVPMNSAPSLPADAVPAAERTEIDQKARAVLVEEWEAARRDYNDVCLIRDLQWAQMGKSDAEIKRLCEALLVIAGNPAITADTMRDIARSALGFYPEASHAE